MENSNSSYDEGFSKGKERKKKEDELMLELRNNKKMREDLEKNLYEIEKRNEGIQMALFEELRQMNTLNDNNNLKETESAGNYNVFIEGIKSNIVEIQKFQEKITQEYKRFNSEQRESLCEQESVIRKKLRDL